MRNRFLLPVRLLAVLALVTTVGFFSCASDMGGSAADTVAPSSVVSLTAKGAESSVVVSWTNPSDLDLAAVRISRTGAVSEPVTVPAANGTYVWSGLSNGTAYTFSVSAVDQNGNVSKSKTVTGTPVALQSVTAIVAHPGSSSVTLTWTDPSYAYLSSIQVTALDASLATVGSATALAGTRTATIAGLTNGSSYTFSLVSVDTYGNKSAAATSEAIVPNTVGDSNTDAWVLTYFKCASDATGNLVQNSLYLGYSTDGLNWTALNSNNPVFSLSGFGGNRIRDPFVFRKNDGTFLYIATDWTTYPAVQSSYWGVSLPTLILADSVDLITFTNVRQVQFVPAATQTARTANSLGSMHCWAPEVFWDASKSKYGVIWSGNGDLAGTDTANRTYINYTTDFTTFEDAQLFFEATSSGTVYTEIDATITSYNGKNYLFFKDETSAKDIQVAMSTTLEPGSFSILNSNAYVTRTTAQATQQGTEGPFVVKDPTQAKWYLFADYYNANGTFGCWSTTDLSADPSLWTKLTSGTQYSFPSGVRHANTVRVTAAELAALKAATW